MIPRHRYGIMIICSYVQRDSFDATMKSEKDEEGLDSVGLRLSRNLSNIPCWLFWKHLGLEQKELLLACLMTLTRTPFSRDTLRFVDAGGGCKFSIEELWKSCSGPSCVRVTNEIYPRQLFRE